MAYVFFSYVTQKIWTPWFGVSLLILAFACSKKPQDLRPEEVVQSYLDIAFNMEKVEQKAILMEFTTGNLKAALAAANDETIKVAYIDHRYDLKRFNVAQRIDKTPNEVELLVDLSYKELPEGSSNMGEAVVVDTQNRIVCVKEDGRWLIKDVVGSNTSMEFPISPLGVIKP